MSLAVVPDVSEFPIWAQAIVYSIVSVSIGATFVLTRLGFLRGKANSPELSNPVSHAQVAAVIVDPTALNAATNAVKEMTGVVKEMSYRVRDLTEAIEKMTVEMVRNGARR